MARDNTRRAAPAENSTDISPAQVPFLRLSNRHILSALRPYGSSTENPTGISSLSELGLYAMLGALLSNPSFTYARGGLQHLLSLHTKNRYFSLHAALRRLQSNGFLLRTRIPEGKNCFHDYYTLFEERRESDCTPVCLSASDGLTFVAARKPYAPPSADFTAISIPMLMDPTLSLSAKGLYIVIARYLRLMKYKPELPLSKNLLRNLCREGSNAFDRMFRELRTAGYLFLTRGYNPQTGRHCYRYSLLQDPCRTEKTVNVPGSGAATERPAASVMSAAPHQTLTEEKNCVRTAERGRTATTREEIHQQIEYACLVEEYPKERLDCIVSILSAFRRTEAGNTPKRLCIGGGFYSREEVAAQLSRLDSEDIRFVLDTYEEVQRTQKIRSIRGYLTACLFRAKETLGLALDAFAARTPGVAPL